MSLLSTRVIRELVNKGRDVGENVVKRFTEMSAIEGAGDEGFGAPARAHFGWVQNFVLDMIASVRTLPVKMAVMTFHEGKGVEKETGAMLYGPGVAGQALTAKLPAELGVLFHCQTDKSKEGNLLYRAYYTKHSDQQNPMVMWPANPRIVPEMTRDLAVRWPGGFIPLEPDYTNGGWVSSIRDFMEWRLDSAGRIAQGRLSQLSRGGTREKPEKEAMLG
jgi:hypothetical protein